MLTQVSPQNQFLAQEHNEYLKTRAGLTHLLRYPASMPVITAVSLSRESYMKDVE